MQLTDFGEIAGSATAAVLPTITGSWVKIKAQASNAGNVYIGKSDVTIAGGTTDATSGWELDAGQETPWLPLVSQNLNELYRICDNAGDDIVYMVLN